MKYKALILDLDGTTVPLEQDSISTPVREAIAKAKTKITVCISTGRLLPEARPLIEMIQPNGPCSVTNGAILYDAVNANCIRIQYLEETSAHQVIQVLQQYTTKILVTNVQIQGVYGGSFPPGLIGIGVANFPNNLTDKVIRELTKITTISVYKMHHADNKGYFIHVADSKATKQYAMYELAELMDIKPNEIIAVGDGYNDFPMLMASGLKVAMGNAVPELKSIADYIAPSVAEDGVKDVIEKFILND